ncbi:MAG TPA: hypothetical protein VMT52_08870 [Planctomycetota bacterium]|nr:hypothetical protein [Planctomycetota bacterium]
MNRREALEALSVGLNVYERKLERKLLEDLAENMSRRLGHAGEEAGETRPEGVVEGARRIFPILKQEVEQLLEGLLALRKRFAEYTKTYSRATTSEEKERHILKFAADLGASPSRVRGDSKAFSRWFGHDAITERYGRRYNLDERKVTLYLDRLGVLAESILAAEPRGRGLKAAWQRLDLEQTLKKFFAYDGDSRVSIAAFRLLSRALRALPAETQERSVDEKTLQFIYRSAMHPRLSVWLQCEALNLLESLSTVSLEKVLRHRLSRPAPGDDLFVRKRAAGLLCRNLARIPELADLLPTLAEDPSPFVRQGFAASLIDTPTEACAIWFERLATRDPVPQVRAAALVAGLRILEKEGLKETVLRALAAVLADDKDNFVLRVAAHIAASGARHLVQSKDSFAREWKASTLPALEKLHLEAPAIPVRRWAAMAHERIWCELTPPARALRLKLEQSLQGLEPAAACSLEADLIPEGDEETAGRVLSVLTQEDYGLELKRIRGKWRMTRGHVFGLRAWRWLYEVRNPSPDKRQAFSHTIGRLFSGDIRAPSTILSELSETRVPGEPLFITEEGGWRPYVPLVDEVLSTLTRRRSSGPVKIYTSEGVTEVTPPGTIRARLKAYYTITTRFADIAKLRNWRSTLQESPAGYLASLEALGFEVRFRPHSAKLVRAVDPTALRFFPQCLPIAAPQLWSRFKDYFVSVYDNSLFELTIFTALACSAFICRHIYASTSVRNWRRNIPLVVGGWGTRGKSGTERLKAALFNGLGYGVVSKTTGCEAMFLFAHAFGMTREMFLFRSYDKATIWEQRDVIRLANRLQADVFLWECMALTPAYVHILQHHWVEDDLSTITNTYPDHEDLQGPAGINIPDVIAGFVPHRAKAVTTEDQMLPILVQKAKDVSTDLRCISWLDSGLLAPDILKRFPYDEHPSNIALVLGLADELGVDRDFALKEMADRVVADLGVLKTSPISRVRSRRLQFANGCSANERHGTLSNWVRCGFNVQDAYAEPGVWITTVVNNRADRVPRSRVFAKILVEDIYADRHFLIGGNLKGLVGYIRQCWDAYAPTISLWPKDKPEDPASVLLEMARRFRLPFEKKHVLGRLKAMLSTIELPPDLEHALLLILDDPHALRARIGSLGIKENVDAILRHHQDGMMFLQEYEAFKEGLTDIGPGDREARDAAFRTFLWKWFQKKIHVVENYHTSGEQLVNTIAEETPPGYLNRVMGVQNIKGTGLDFVYRWQAWDTCYKACELLRSSNPLEAERGLRGLAAFHEYGVLSAEHMAETLQLAKRSPAAQSEHFQAELALIQSTYDVAMAELSEKLGAVQRESSRLESVIKTVEGFLDAGDAVKRRKLANQIYKDLVNERISTERAVIELQGLNKRQKGGWLFQKFLSAQSFISKNIGGILGRTVK